MRTKTLAFLLLAGVIAGCSSMSTSAEFAGDQNAGRSGETAAPTGDAPSNAAPAPGSGPTEDGVAGQPGSQTQVGQLTAGVWDDNLNFEFFKKYLAVEEQSAFGLPIFTADERQSANAKFAARAAKTELDVAVLFDTTGSMGDELSYIQREMQGIASTVATKFPGATARYALVVYRDTYDDYVTRSFDFTATLSDFQRDLGYQKANGGGDYPEAVEAGLEAMNKLSWRTGPSTAKLTFWIADAPAHEQDAAVTKAGIAGAVQSDIHIYPVAASGTDRRAEYTMRTAAQMTGGRYLFLTDDSGIGGAHAEPHIPCYVVTRFDGALVRMVESEMTGNHVFATAEQTIRTVGSPVGGKCETASRGQVVLY